MDDTTSKELLSINLHLTKRCNMYCRYCHSHFALLRDIGGPAWLDLIAEIDQSTRHGGGKRKITFAGGEPTLLPYLGDLIRKAKSLGFFVSVITNALLLRERFDDGALTEVDEIGISIDSIDVFQNELIGRVDHFGQTIDYREVCSLVRDNGKRLKINTVVSRENHLADMSAFIAELRPLRWKIFQVRVIEGDNATAGEYTVTAEQFTDFVLRNSKTLPAEIVVVPESCEAQAGSYVMVSPDGRLFDSASETYSYSPPISDVGFAEALTYISFSDECFRSRGGDHFRNWRPDKDEAQLMATQVLN